MNLLELGVEWSDRSAMIISFKSLDISHMWWTFYRMIKWKFITTQTVNFA